MPRLFPVPPRLVAAAVLAAGGLLAAPGRASAGCGDYVSVAPDTPDEARAGHHDPAGPAAPCHGPGCSNAPSHPTPPLSAPGTARTESDPWAGGLSDDPNPADASSRRPRPADDGRAVHFPRPIFHPPRAG